MSGCSWWSLALAFVGGLGVGQVGLMTVLVLMTGAEARDEHEGGV